MTSKNLPSQFEDAKQLYADTKNKLGSKYEIIFTGHSLGGSLAQLMGAKYGNETVTFNAYGTANLKGADIKYANNITNYGNPSDKVFNNKANEHIGKKIYVKSHNKVSRYNELENHNLKNLGNLKKIYS